MTAEMRIQIASREHSLKQPRGFPYALFCEPVLTGERVECSSITRLGFLGNFRLKRELGKLD